MGNLEKMSMRRVRGLSLAEAVIGATVLALAAAVILSLLPSSMLSVRRSERQMQAAALAQSQLEQQKLIYFDDLVDAALPGQYAPDGIPFASRRSVAAGGSPNAKVVRITVSWREHDRDFQVFRELVVTNMPR